MSAQVPQHAEGHRIDACVYLLHMLLQRAEQQQPGLLDSLIRGVAADRDGVRAQGPADPADTGVFDEALRVLELANEQLKSQPQP
ncbi:hypothetical protein B551_0223035 [Cupriavidus sp. HPC(L)]|uniref:hypothetical protein n=1 Tax=Cupriavidus sp. HPC(L) TaxID=1217418 RepID=UPI0002916105|nr:hypothetical protein [Cupriavidus sp. HPC(L)]ESH90059.1 hypothetical protein B551_0223035 [Cupriavidus sp. HPC(L)]